MYVSSQYPTPLDNSRMTWDNKRGWSIPRQSIDSVPMLIGFSCVATLGGKEYQSADYLIHTTGKKTRKTNKHYICVINSVEFSLLPAKMSRTLNSAATKT